SLAVLTPYQKWCEELDISQYPRRLPTREECRQLAQNATAQDPHARLGANLETPNLVLIKQFPLPITLGLVVEEVEKDSAAEKAGLKVKDFWLNLEGRVVPSNSGDFARLLEESGEDTPANVVVLRRGKEVTLEGLGLPERVAPASGPVAERVW